MSDFDLESNKNSYLENTHRLNDYNEIYNLNSHLQKSNTLEISRLQSTDNILKSKVLKLKQEYLLLGHDTKVYHFRMNVMYFSAMVLGILFVIAAAFMVPRAPPLKPMITGKIAIWSSCIIAIVYLIIILLVVKAHANRRAYSYNQFYWNDKNQ